MSYTITPSLDGKCIILTIRGEINRINAMQQNQEAHALGRKMNINRYLVDVTEARNTDTIMDDYEFAYKDMRKTNGIDKTARIALLVSPDDHSHDFIETVARNAGLNVTKFTNQEHAKKFLE